ncbi:MarR family winged helix-turn-helix transcriptional regulator [Aliiroseovarius sp. Z3]|uniref:MarR family winged helix-turn-helix transcriptional regulator n=1 Tax=Aliiroseovarius sp. Z3 TaxID=2811402 RepID=UPI0023B2DF0C|nr:MarR family winged helix-turn-helix transcriptional regulator [Aliiroseovarius sp. Z3]
MTHPDETNHSHDAPIEPELGALLGVFALHGFIESLMEDVDRKVDSKIDVPYFERKILVWLDHPKRLGTLARELNVLPSTMTTAADQLEARGLVVRERDPDDRRAWLLKLTGDGANLRSAMVVMARTLLCETLELTDDELNSFAKTSLKIHRNIQKYTTC